jgi:chromosome segregation ATPase
VAAVFWVLPRAASSRRLANDKASLQVSVSQARRELEQAREKLVTLQAQLSELQAARDELEGRATKNGRQIAALNKKIKALEGEKKAAEAAAAAAAAAAATGGGVGVSSVPPPPIPCHTVYSTNFSPSVYCPSP